jgi:anti-sigma-K factor RskA
VSSGTEHRAFSDSLAAYALGALSEDECARVREHLAGCHECRAELEWLRSAVDALPASVPQVEPPPELKSRVMDTVDREAELLRAAGHGADRPEPSAGRRRWWPSISGVRPSVVLVGACAVAVIVVGVILSLNSTVIRNTRTIHAQVMGPAHVAGARASVRLTGSHAELVVSRLPAPAANQVDELWVQRGNGAPVPAGTFIVSSGSVMVEHPVKAGDHVLVTVEPGRGTRAPTSTPFIVAKA